MGDTGARRVPALDGLRGVAILLVLASHAGLPHSDYAGIAGVTVFFTLSGYLITGLLLVEHDRIGRVDLRAFYRRRALRLAPALVAMVAAFGAVVAVRGEWDNYTAETLAALTYTTSFFRAMSLAVPRLDLTWSLSVEEAFYLTWPALLLFLLAAFRSRRAVTWTVVGLAVGAAAWRVGLYQSGSASWDRVRYAPDTNYYALLFGCAAALLPSWNARRWPVLALLVIVAFSAFPPRVWLPGATLANLGTVVVAACTVVLAGSRVSWLAVRPLVAAGTISYGLYLWEAPALYVLGKGPAAMAVTVVAALLSWRFIEQPFLRRKGSARLGVEGNGERDQPRGSAGAVSASGRRASR